MAHLYGAVLHCVEDLQARNNFARRESLDLEFSVGRFRNIFSESSAGAEQSIERLGPACGQSPFDRRSRLCDRRLGNGNSSCACPYGCEKFTTFHGGYSLRWSTCYK